MIAHIGYHKTGTTFLQNNVYPYIKGVEIIGYEACNTIFNPLINKATPDYDTAKTRELLTGFLHSGSVHLFSFEGLVGPLFYHSGMHKFEIADRLKELGFTKIIISIRNQHKMLESIYVQYIQEGGTAKPMHFFDPQNKIFDWDYANYYNLVKYYFDLFGKENVLVILQEELQANEHESIQRILFLLGDKFSLDKNRKARHANISLSSLSVRLLRVINHFTYSPHKPSQLISRRISTWKFRFLLQNYLDPFLFSKLSSATPFTPDSLKPAIESYFKEGNRKLSELLDIDLTKYKYPV